MAKTPQDIINAGKSLVHGAPTDDVQLMALNNTMSEFHNYFPWSWTIQSFTAITCVDGTQDYVINNADQGNVLRPLKIRLALTSTTPAEYRELAALNNLSPELSRKGGLDYNTAYGWFASSNTIRLMMAASVGTGQTLQIQGEYQKIPTEITADKLATAFPFPDFHFGTFLKGFLYWLYLLTDDPRAGSIQLTKNGRTSGTAFVGQLGVWMQALAYSARNEELALGDSFQYPETALGSHAGSFSPGLFGI